MLNTNNFIYKNEYRNKWGKILEIITQIKEENINLSIQHIEYIITDYCVLSFLASKEILQYSKNFDFDCANCGLDCKDLILDGFINYVKTKYNVEPAFFIKIYKKIANIKDNDVNSELFSGFFFDNNWKLNILLGINPSENYGLEIANINLNNNNNINMLEHDDSIENYIL